MGINDVIEIEGQEIQVEYFPKDAAKDAEGQKRRLCAYEFRKIREQANMNRKEFAEWLGIPYRTMQDWELGKSQVPDYIVRLVAYKVQMEKEKGRI